MHTEYTPQYTEFMRVVHKTNCSCSEKTIGAVVFGLWWVVPCAHHRELYGQLRKLEEVRAA